MSENNRLDLKLQSEINQSVLYQEHLRQKKIIESKRKLNRKISKLKSHDNDLFKKI